MMPNRKVSSVSSSYIISTATSSGDISVHSTSVVARVRPTIDKNIINAVYSHIRAIRALGHTRVNSADISDALGILQKDVDKAIRELTDKGVKVIK